jgi:hypothetical protein
MLQKAIPEWGLYLQIVGQVAQLPDANVKFNRRCQVALFAKPEPDLQLRNQIKKATT